MGRTSARFLFLESRFPRAGAVILDPHSVSYNSMKLSSSSFRSCWHSLNAFPRSIRHVVFNAYPHLIEVDGLLNDLFPSWPPRFLAHCKRLSKFKGVIQVDKFISFLFVSFLISKTTLANSRIFCETSTAFSLPRFSAIWLPTDKMVGSVLTTAVISSGAIIGSTLSSSSLLCAVALTLLEANRICPSCRIRLVEGFFPFSSAIHDIPCLWSSCSKKNPLQLVHGK